VASFSPAEQVIESFLLSYRQEKKNWAFWISDAQSGLIASDNGDIFLQNQKFRLVLMFFLAALGSHMGTICGLIFLSAVDN